MERFVEFANFIWDEFLSVDTKGQLGPGNKMVIDAQKKSLCLMNTDIMAVAANLTGGKGSSLALLNTIKGVKVPEFFVVTTAGFKAHF